jgi:Na+/alanine symporter
MQTSHTSVGQSSVNVIDIVALIMPWIIIMIVLMVVFAVPEMFDRVFKNAF